VGPRSIRLLIGLGGVIVVLLLAFKLVGGIYSVPSESMAPTLKHGAHVTVLNLGAAEVGEIVVVNPPAGAETDECGGGVPPAGQMCAKPTFGAGPRQVHQARRGRGRRPHRHA
jgi:signal peptidase I